MKVTVLEAVPEDPEIILAWNNLVLQMDRPEVFYTHQWALAASRAFSRSLCPLTFLFHQSGDESSRLVGVAALAVARDAPDKAFFLSASTADYCDILSEPDLRADILAMLFQEMNRRNLRNAVLANVPAGSPTLPALKTIAQSQNFHVHERPGYDCGVIALGDEEQRQTVLRSVVRKEKEKRGLKKLSLVGPIQVNHLSAENLDAGLDPIFAAQISRFLATGRLSPLIQPQRRDFLAELAKLLSPAGWLKVSQLEVGGQPVAWNYGFRFLDSWFWYLPTYQLQYEGLSPGSCLLRLLTEEACADSSVKRLDLGLGDESYKQRFCNAVSPTRYLQLSRGTAQHLVNVSRYNLVTAVGKSVAVEKKLRAARQWFHSLHKRIGATGAVATASYAMARAKGMIASADEVAFFEAPPIEVSESESEALRPLTWEGLAAAAMSNAGDEQTLQYLIRCGKRLRQGGSSGYFLSSEGRVASHFLWVDPYDGFYLSEIDSKLESNDPNAVMIFDCWTPVAQRGHGHYATAIRLAAAHLQKQKKQAWIFGAARNEPSVSGILKAGFVYRFSLVRSKKFFHNTLSRHTDRSPHH